MTRPSLAHYRKSLSLAAPEPQRPTAQELHDFQLNPHLVAPERHPSIQAYIKANYIDADAHPPPT